MHMQIELLTARYSISLVAMQAGTVEAPNSVRTHCIHITVVQCGISTLIDICKDIKLNIIYIAFV